ncbi:MAG TPA: hypothetical protein VM681_03890 [Candidatus Thermoplasmatota archaeon]|nr:hypothetical protein [Candidatus Thermoplasmatota archaeon]
MTKGLDVGTMNITCAKKADDRIRFTQQRNTFVELEHSDIAERMLERSDVLHIRHGSHVYIVGEDALNFANIFNTSTSRPMSAGILSRKEKKAIPMIQLMVERLLGKPGSPGETCYFNVPANPVDDELDTLYHQKTLGSLVERAGYTPHPINEGMSVVYSELADQKFTGVGISWGAGMTNVCFAYYAVPVLQFSVARGGDWIDKQASVATGVPVDKVTARKEKGVNLNWESKIGDLEGALSIYYENLIDYVVKNLAKEARRKNVEEGLKIPVAITGGTCQPKGFDKLLLEKLRGADLPFEVDRVIWSDEPIFSVVRGDLVAALSEDGGEKKSKK